MDVNFSNERNPEIPFYENPWEFPSAPEKRRSVRKPGGRETGSEKPEKRRLRYWMRLVTAAIVLYLLLVFPLQLYQAATDTNSVYGYYIVRVDGDSMEPLLHHGQFKIGQKTDFSRLREGDIVVYADGKGGYIIHRIIARTDTELITQGDANDTPDPDTVRENQVLCVVRIPGEQTADS